MSKQELKKYLAELLGTGLLVFVACGVAVFSNGNLVATALAFGLILMAIIYVIGGISGAHVNPAVSLGAFIRGKLSAKDFGFYALAQVLGAIVGGALLFGIFKLLEERGFNYLRAVNGYGSKIDDINGIFSGLLVEIILTFAFVLTILGVTSKSENGKIAGIVIGLTLALVHLFGIGVTGTSVNPARSIGVAIFGAIDNVAAIEQIWLFIVAPMAGGALAGLAAIWLFKDKDGQPDKLKVSAGSSKQTANNNTGANKSTTTNTNKTNK